MAPSQLQIHNRRHPDHAKTPTVSRLRGSKAQLCLQKILHTILTVAASGNDSTPTQNEEAPATKAEDPAPQSPAVTVGIAEVAIEREAVFDPVVSNEIDDDRSSGTGEGGGDCMALLIQAATLIFGGINEDEDDQTATETAKSTAKETGANVKRRRNERWTVDLYADDMGPVVRSKRGRTQVLPCKFRDSVIEPLTRASRNRQL